MDYEVLKSYPPYEVDILTRVMNDINDSREKMVNRSTKGTSGSFDDIGISDTIGS